MSGKERKRLVVLADVKKGGISLAEAGRLMGVSYRQAKRIWRCFKKKGEAGLIHGNRGKAGRRRKPAREKRQALALYRKRYPDFGPTLAAEKMEESGLSLDHETLRRWLLAEGLWSVRRKRSRHRSWRERRECFGQMVQLDGSHHDWFEGRRERAVLMVMVDDATNYTVARMFEEETTEASYRVFMAWVKENGVPESLYVDRDSIYRCEREPTVAEQIGGKEPLTQFGRAMEQMGVKVILANSPQAKGRVERRNGLLQDRLVKEMRLAGINGLEKANEFLNKTFLFGLNKKFTVEARSPRDAHGTGPGNLEEILSWEYERVVAQDWTVAWENRWFQIKKEHELLGLVRRKVIVRIRLDGQIEIVHKGKKLNWKELGSKPIKSKERPETKGRAREWKAEQEHPWKKDLMGYGKQFWKEIKAKGAREKAARRQAAAASGQPSLRCGFPTSAAA